MPDPRPAKMLERALALTFVCHGLAMLGMVVFLLPAMPGGGTLDDAARMAYVAEHPWRFRLGWLPWHLTALSDVFLAWALLRTPWIPRGHARLSLALTAVAVVIDQGAQAAWVTHGVALAQRPELRDLSRATFNADLAAYLAFESIVFPMTGWWAAFLYTLGAIVWSFAFARARTWSRTLTVLSIVLWSLFLTVTIGPFLGLPHDVVAAGNAAGFVMMQIWFLLVLSRVVRASRPDTAPRAPHSRRDT